MTDSDFQSLKPVESLHNIQGLTPAQPREERKRRQQAPGERSQPPKKEEDKDKPATAGDAEPHAIDYCA
jgi:hypothetical protein